MAVGAVFALLLTAAGPAAADVPQPVDTGTFQNVTLAHDLTAPTVVKFAPNGLGTRMFIALKSGVVLAYDQPDDPNPIQVVDLSTEVDDFWDRGLLGMTLSPGFNESGGYMYLLYARDAAIGGTPPRWKDACPSPPGAEEGGCVISGKLVRVPIGALGSPTGPVQTLIQDQWCQQFPSHSIGTVAFGPDGMLYVSAGEGANFNAADWGQYGYPTINPCHDPYNAADPTKSEGGALRSQDVRTPGDPTGLSGTIIRVNPATGAPAPGNPFAGPDTNAKRIIAYGMRNPFRFTFRPGSHDIWVGDVGWNSVEEVDKVPTAPPVKENLGWPCYEGSTDNPAYAQQSLCGNNLPSTEVTMPEFLYWHGESVVSGDGCELTSGSAITGLAFLPSTSNYPVRFHGGLFFTDYARNCIWFAPAGAGGEPDFTNLEVFARGPSSVGPVDLEIAPNGNLVFVFHDQTFGEIDEIRPVDQPTAKIDVTDHGGGSFTFDGSSSTPAGVTYAWDVHDGGPAFGDGTGATLDESWSGRSAKTVSLKVTKNGISDITSVRVGVGNTPPDTPQITKVSVPSQWAAGDHLKFSGTAVDPDAADQGHLTLTWVMTILHCPNTCHKHPVQTLTGPTADFVAPAHEYPSSIQITLQATDTLGFSSPLATLVLQPKVINFTTRATPSPFTVSLNGIAGNPLAETLIAGTPVTVSTTSPQVLNGRRYGFAGWSDGDRHLSRVVAPRATSTLTARFIRLPLVTALPTVTGDTRTSHTLTGSTGGWTGDQLTFSYQWLRCAAACAPIPGATARTYTLGDADRGQRVALRVTAHNAAGALSSQSALTAAIGDGTPPTLRLSGSKRRKLGDGRLRIRARCPSERCTLGLTPVLLIAGRQPIVTSRVVTKTLRGGKKVTITVRLSGKQRRAAAKALRAHKAVAARVDGTATDRANNRSLRSFTTQLH